MRYIQPKIVIGTCSFATIIFWSEFRGKKLKRVTQIERRVTLTSL